jgi:cytochrome P450
MSPVAGDGNTDIGSIDIGSIDIGSIDIGSIDIASAEVYERGIPHAAFARLRREDPVHWHPWEWSTGGFWAITTLDDLTTVTRDWETFTSNEFVNLWDLSSEAMAARRSLIETDGPEHVRLRRLVTTPFTLKRMPEYEPATTAIIDGLLDRIVGAGEVDLVNALSEPLPIQVFVSILGVDSADGEYLVELSSQLVEGTSDRVLDPHAYGNTTPLELLPFNSPASHALFEFGRALGEERRACPADDLVSRLVTAEVDGDRLTDQEYCNFFQLLVFAGNETTRTAISNGLLALMRFPDQLQRLKDDPSLVPNAVEEIIRWSTPVLHMRRTATRDTVLHDVPIAAGDRVVLWYASANFDESHFPDPLAFDVGRALKPSHTSFGAFGPHQCLGAHLARLELRLLLQAMVDRDLTVTQLGEPVRTRSNFVNGVISLNGRIDAT